MPTFPWTMPRKIQNGNAADVAFVMAARMEVDSLRTVPRCFLRSLVAWRRMKRTPGLLDASLVAEPFKRTFWTLSAWDGRGSRYEYARANPQAEVMRRFRPVMRRTTFLTWTMPASELPLDWAGVKQQLLDSVASETPA